jgi:2-keto-4-pentenoate hydratase/2-oxohepta-3-ene-1,7-dioic acid hydratase in catechol pathway
VVTDEGGVDVHEASGGRFGPAPRDVFEQWEAFRAWADEGVSSPVTPFEPGDLGAPSPLPRQVFSIGANYPDHAEEADFAIPTTMEVFSKFPTCIAGPYVDVPLPDGDTDWEAELVIVMGKEAHNIAEDSAWDHVAGVTIGQDYSERVRQMAASQWGLAKSHPNFGPTGPWLVTTDAVEDKDDLDITCAINGEQVQHGRSARMVFSVSQIITEIASISTLLPGDLIFTGTMSGVGLTRKPPVYLKVGDVVTTEIAGIGKIENRIVAGT